MTWRPAIAHYAGDMPQYNPEPLQSYAAEAPPPQTTLPLLVSALIGAGVGLVTALPFEPHWEKQWPLSVLALVAFMWTAGIGAVFLPTPRQRWGAVGLGVVVGLFGLLQANLPERDGKFINYLNPSGWPLLAALGLAGLFLLAGWEGKRFDRRLLPPFITHSLLTFVLAAILGSLFYGLMSLAVGLLQAIGITQPARWILGNPKIFLPLLLGASSFFVTAIRAQPWGLNLTRTLANVLSFLLPVAAGIVLLFAVALPVAALQSTDKLYQGILSSPLYLTLTVAFFGLTLAAFSARPVALPTPIQRFAKYATFLLPLYPALALYGLSVRVGQYGLTESRLLGLVGAIWLIGTALALSLTRLKPAFAGLSRLTAGSLAGLATLSLILSLPGVRPMELSARSQAARLTRDDLSARQSAEIISQLAYSSGGLGKALLTRIPDSALSETARNQRRRSENMTSRAFAQAHFQGRADMRDVVLTASSLPVSAAQRAAIQKLMTEKNMNYGGPARLHAMPAKNGIKVLVYTYSWNEGLWADLDASGKVTASGSFTSLERPYQTKGIDWNDKDPFTRDTRTETLTVPAVRVGGATLILNRE